MENGDEEVAEDVPLPAFDQHFPARDWTNHTMGDNPRDLRRSQRRKHE